MQKRHPYSVFHDFNHESPLVRKFVKRNLQFLLNEYHIDGFRFDLTKGFCWCECKPFSVDDKGCRTEVSTIVFLQ